MVLCVFSPFLRLRNLVRALVALCRVVISLLLNLQSGVLFLTSVFPRSLFAKKVLITGWLLLSKRTVLGIGDFF